MPNSTRHGEMPNSIANCMQPDVLRACLLRQVKSKHICNGNRGGPLFLHIFDFLRSSCFVCKMIYTPVIMLSRIADWQLSILSSVSDRRLATVHLKFPLSFPWPGIRVVFSVCAHGTRWLYSGRCLTEGVDNGHYTAIVEQS